MGTFDLKLGFQCNNDCIHCVVADKRSAGKLSLDEMLSIISKVKPGSYLQITGGEPTTFKEELPVILKYAKERGLLPTIQTNATGFADEDFIAKCAPYVYNWHIAIHSYNPEIHDKIVKSKGMWDLTMRGFKNALKYPQVILTTQTVLSKLNIDTLYETYEMIQELSPGTQMSMTYPHLNGNAWKNREEIAFKFSEHGGLFRKILQKWGDLIFTESIPYCYTYPFLNHPSLEEEIIYNNEGRIGIDFSQGNDLHDYNKSDIEDRRKAPRCRECMLNHKCIGVWKEYIEFFKNKLDLTPLTEERIKKLDEKYNRCKN